MHFLGLDPLAFGRYRVRAAASALAKRDGGGPARARHGVLIALLFFLSLVAFGGCGSSDNGVASKSGKEILAASKLAAVSASSVHVVGRTSQGRLSLTIDLELGSDASRAHVSLVGNAFEVIRIGSTVYVRGTPAFYKRLGATQGVTLRVPEDAWLKALTNSGPLAQLAAYVDLRGELNRLLSTPGPVTKGATTTVNGQKVIELKETTKVYKGVLYVATAGKPYPVVLAKTGGRETGRTTFSEWDEPMSVTAPSPSVDIGSPKR